MGRECGMHVRQAGRIAVLLCFADILVGASLRSISSRRSSCSARDACTRALYYVFTLLPLTGGNSAARALGIGEGVIREAAALISGASGWCAALLVALLDNACHGLVAAMSWAYCAGAWASARTPPPSHSRLSAAAAKPQQAARVGCFGRVFRPCAAAAALVARAAALGGEGAPLTESAAAYLLASAMDADHFLAAASLRLTAATSLSSRPFAHAVAFVAVSAAAGGVAAAHVPRVAGWLSDGASRARTQPSARRRCPLGWRAAALVACALGTHQLRDAHRRGLWLWPFGSTAPLPYVVYVGATACLPLVARLCATLSESAAHRRSAASRPAALL